MPPRYPATGMPAVTAFWSLLSRYALGWPTSAVGLKNTVDQEVENFHCLYLLINLIGDDGDKWHSDQRGY